MTIKIKIESEITFYSGKYQNNEIYYQVKYDGEISPKVIIIDKLKLDLLLREREKISVAEYSNYLKYCTIGTTTFCDRKFEPTFKTKARRKKFYD